jgi:hypothetical protein
MKNCIEFFGYLLITILLQFIGFLIYEESSKDIRVLFYGIPILFFIIACWQGKKIFIFTKRARMVEHPAPFDSDLIDCYVRFTGKIVEGAGGILPWTKKRCAFYMATIQAEWTSRQKKPHSGTITHRKHILRDQSSKELALTGKKGTVYVDLSTFNKDQLALHEYAKSQSICPPEVLALQKNNPTYQLMERFIQVQDTVSVQGRLVQKNDGRLFIEGTKAVQYPSFVMVHERQTLQKKKEGLQLFLEDLKEQARRDACTGGLRAFFLSLNGLMVLYFLIFLKNG